jgi:hypothetical protein
LVLWAAPCLAQTPADLFDDEVLHELRLEVHPRDWDRLKATFLENTYYPADLRWIYKGQPIEAQQVAIRSRGTGSRNPVKPGLRLDINRYNTNHRFVGLREITLRNNTQDATMIRERVAFALMRKLGLPAPRVSHTRLYVNNEYMGLYSIVESINEDFLFDRFKDSDGYLYEYDYGFYDPPYFFEYKGENPESYAPKPFQPETHEDRPQLDRIVSFIRTINLSSDQDFERAIAEFVDLKALAAEMAAEAYIAELDGIIGDYGLNNFYLYRQSGSNRFFFLPWDKSQTFTQIDRPSRMNLDTNRLARRAFTIPAVEETFRSVLAAAAATAGGTGGWLENEVLRAYNQVGNAARQDPYKQCVSPGSGLFGFCSNEDFETAVAELIFFVRGRYTQILRELAQNSTTPLPTGDQSFEIPDGAAAVFTTSNSSANFKTAHGYIEASTGSSLPSALTFLSYKKNNILISETAFVAGDPLRSGRIHAEVNGPVTSAVALANANNKAANVTFYFTDSAGNDYGHGSVVVPPGGQIAGFLDGAPFRGTSPMTGTFTFSASLPVGALALRGLTNERGEFLIAAMPIGNVFGSSSTASVIPHFSTGGGWSSEIQLVNIEDAPNEGVLQLRLQTGDQTYPYMVPPRSSTRIQLLETPERIDGSVQISTVGRLPVFGEVLSQRIEGVVVSQTVVQAASERSSHVMFGEANGLQSSYVLVNNGPAEAKVTIDVTSTSGTPGGYSGALAVPGLGRLVVNLKEIPGLQTLPSNFQGVLRLTSSAPIYAAAFGNHTNQRGETLTTALPWSEESLSGYLSFPHIVDSGGYETRIVLMGTSVGATTGGVFKYRDGLGELVDLGLR